MATELAHLTCVDVICRSYPQLDALPHVFCAIDGFVNSSTLWTLESATLKALVRLLGRLAPREQPGVTGCFREERLIHNIKQATAMGYLDVVQWWLRTYFPGQLGSYWPIIIPAIENGQLHVLQWALAQKPSSWFPVSRYRCDHASVVYWIQEQKLPLRLLSNVNEIAKAGDLEFLKWLQKHSEIATESSNALVVAMERGDFDMVQWHVETQPEFSQSDEYMLSRFYSDEENRYRFDLEYDLELPEPLEASEGHVRICRWLATEYKWKNDIARRSWIQSTRLYTSACGSFEILNIIDHQQRLLDAERHELRKCMEVAAFHGHFDLVKWFHAKGVCFDKQVLDCAATLGSIEMVQLILNEPRALTKYAHCHAMDLAAAHNHLNIVQLLHYRGLESCRTTNAMDAAAAEGHIDIVRWLHANRTEGCTFKAMDDAAAHGHLEMAGSESM